MKSDGKEAEELRAGIEAILANEDLSGKGLATHPIASRLRHLLDDVDACDSLVHVQAKTRKGGCPCEHVEPCHPHCTCARSFMSHGCQRCCRYGSPEQQN